MERLAKKNLGLVDAQGTPLSAPIQRALCDLVPRFRREFPTLHDDAVITDILEEAGCRIAEQEKRGTPIERLNAYAWVALRRTAVSRLRRSSMRLASATLGSEQSEAALANVASRLGSAEQIEREIFLEEALSQLSDEERDVVVLKTLGFSSEEIAVSCKADPSRVDSLFHRAKQKIRRIWGVQE